MNTTQQNEMLDIIEILETTLRAGRFTEILGIELAIIKLKELETQLRIDNSLDALKPSRLNEREL